MAKQREITDLFRRAASRPADAPAPEAATAAGTARGDRAPRSAPEGKPRAGDEPLAFPLSEDPWERKVAALERLLHQKNLRILALEGESLEREERMKEALLRLREAEDAAEIGAQLAQFPADGSLPQPPPAPDALARLATEKGALETHGRQLRAETDRLKAQAVATERTVRARDAALSALKESLDRRDQDVRTLEKQLEEAELQIEKARGDSEERFARIVDEQARTDERTSVEAVNRRKLEQSLASAEQQAALYRKTLVKTEESLRGREAELLVAISARDQAVERSNDLEKTQERLRAEVDGLERKLSEAETEAAAASAELLTAQGDLERTRARLGHLERDLAQARERITGLEAKSAERKAAAAAADDELLALRAREAALRAERARLASEAAGLRLALARLSANATAAEAALLAEQRAAGRRLLAATQARFASGPEGGERRSGPDAARSDNPSGAVGALRRWFGKG